MLLSTKRFEAIIIVSIFSNNNSGQQCKEILEDRGA